MTETHLHQAGQREEPTGSRNPWMDQRITVPEGQGLTGNREQLDPPSGLSLCLYHGGLVYLVMGGRRLSHVQD